MSATPSRPSGNGAHWESGRCRRDHDITDPANVRVVRRSNGDVGRECRPCVRYTERARRSGHPVQVRSVFQNKACEHCGTEYSPTWDDRKKRKRRRYCSMSCCYFARAAMWQAKAEEQLAREEQSRPKVPAAELARMRRMVGFRGVA